MIVHILSIDLCIHAGLGAAKADPPSGSEISNFEGTVNATTLTCNITNDQTGNQEITSWLIGNFRGVLEVRNILADLAPDLFLFSGDPVPSNPNYHFINQLTILRWTSELDEVMLYCGGAGAAARYRQANFTLRVYRKQLLT